MSMSDDEDEDDEDILPKSDLEDHLEDHIEENLNLFEPEDIVLPPLSPTSRSQFSHSSLPSTEEEYSQLGGRKASQRRGKKRPSKASEWFPLKSFIDLYNDNDDDSGPSNWNWRSFIEVSNVV